MQSIFKYTRDKKDLFPKAMLASLVTNSISVTDVQIEFIVDTKCQIHLLGSKEYFIQYIYNNNCRNLC